MSSAKLIQARKDALVDIEKELDTLPIYKILHLIQVASFPDK